MKKNVNNEIFREYFNHQNPSALAKNLLKANEAKNQAKNKQIVNQANYALTNLFIINEVIPENENLD